MHRWIPLLAIAGSFAVVFHQTREEPTPEVATAVREPVTPPPPKVFDVLHTIERGETLGVILQNVGLSSHDIQAAAKEHYDLAKIRAGKTITFKVLEGEKTPHIVLYPLDEDNTVRVERTNDTWTASLETIEYQATEAIREFTVTSTFWGAAVEAGLRASDIARLAAVFKFDVDFNTEIRGGAHVKLVIEELYVDGRFAKLGTPLVARLENKDDSFVAIHHESADGETGYYDLNGVARKKAFLRSPIPFSRVTSGFNPRRYHPVLKKRRPHNGTDFGAPQGTPIRATGSGVVVSAGRNGGHGNFVKIDHPGPYASSYSHMHRIKVRKGQKIKQGQIIGTVGTTGLSTGPHLHYQFWKNNRFVDPMTADLPRTQKLPNSEKAAFNTNKSNWIDFMDGVQPAVAMTEQP